MNKKAMLAVGLCVVLLVCSVIYFRPLPLSGCIPENGSLLLHSNTFGVQNGKPYIHSEAYDHKKRSWNWHRRIPITGP